MKWISTMGDGIRIELSELELVVVNNALNEVLNGIDLFEFSTRIGVERDQVVELLSQVSAALDRRPGDFDELV
jgi:hypothetical protein